MEKLPYDVSDIVKEIDSDLYKKGYTDGWVKAVTELTKEKKKYEEMYSDAGDSVDIRMGELHYTMRGFLKQHSIAKLLEILTSVVNEKETEGIY